MSWENEFGIRFGGNNIWGGAGQKRRYQFGGQGNGDHYWWLVRIFGVGAHFNLDTSHEIDIHVGRVIYQTDTTIVLFFFLDKSQICLIIARRCRAGGKRCNNQHLHICTTLSLTILHFHIWESREKRFKNPLSTNRKDEKLKKKKGFGNVAWGSSPHRVHFEHSLLHDSVTTDRRKRQYYDVSTESVASIKESDKKCVNPLHQHRCCCCCCARQNGSQSDGYLGNLSDRWSVVWQTGHCPICPLNHDLYLRLSVSERVMATTWPSLLYRCYENSLRAATHPPSIAWGKKYESHARYYNS